MRHINIPVFIPHLGCPNNCVFCNQRRISGKMDFDIASVKDELERAFETVDYSDSEVEIAFFGGSFTGIDRGDMLYLLGLAKHYIREGKASAVRLSTRPDYIDHEILDILKSHGVTAIELGLQSMAQDVLAASKRGHTAECAEAACRMIKEHGFNLVGQMMIGLPMSTEQSEVETARKIVSLGCDAARIYPTVVFTETELCEMMNRGEYMPLTLSEAVQRSADVLTVFAESEIPVIRLGLCAADNLFEPGTIAAGEYHSAVGEMVYSELYYRKIRAFIEANGLTDKLSGRDIRIHVPIGEVSKVSGQKHMNKLRLQREYAVKSVKTIENPSLSRYNITIEC